MALTPRAIGSKSATNGAEICLAVTIGGETIGFDFSGTAPQVAGSLNAVEAIALSACYYVVACLLGPDVPLNAGTFAPHRSDGAARKRG